MRKRDFAEQETETTLPLFDRVEVMRYAAACAPRLRKSQRQDFFSSRRASVSQSVRTPVGCREQLRLTRSLVARTKEKDLFCGEQVIIGTSSEVHEQAVIYAKPSRSPQQSHQDGAAAVTPAAAALAVRVFLRQITARPSPDRLTAGVTTTTAASN